MNLKTKEFLKVVKLFKPRYVIFSTEKSRLRNKKWWELAFGRCDHSWIIKLNSKKDAKGAVDAVEKIVPVINYDPFEEVPCGDC